MQIKGKYSSALIKKCIVFILSIVCINIYIKFFLVTSLFYFENAGSRQRGILDNYYVTYEYGKLTYETRNLYIYDTVTYEKKLGIFDIIKLYKILKKYDVENWQPQNEYKYFWSDVLGGYGIVNPTANYVQRGELYSLSQSPAVQYIGITDDELQYRYEYSIGIDYKGKRRRYMDSYGIPQNANEFSEELWDFVFTHVNAVDFRDELEVRRNEIMELVYPSLCDAEGIPDFADLKYFSINEFFGNIDSGINICLKFNSPEYADNGYLTFSTICRQKTYFVDSEGEIQLYNNIPANKVLEVNEKMNHEWSLYLDDRGSDELSILLEKYSKLFILLSEDKRENRQSIKKNEVGYKSYIYIYDFSGRKIRKEFNDYSIVEEYYLFKNELWSFIVEYINRTGETIEPLSWQKDLELILQDYLRKSGGINDK